MQSIDILTAITGDRDEKRDDIVCMSDYDEFKKPVMNAKIYKVLSHKFLDSDIIIWIDGNIFPLISNEELVDKYLGDADIAIFKHPFRDTVWEEFKTLKGDERFHEEWLQKMLELQKTKYQEDGLPRDANLMECNFIIKRNTEKVNRFMESWWAEICRWQYRDQISFPYVMWKYGKDLKVNTIDSNIRLNNDFRHIEHD